MDSDGVKELISKNISLLQISKGTQSHTPTSGVCNVISNNMDNKVVSRIINIDITSYAH